MGYVATLELTTSKWASKVNGWMDIAMHPTPTEPPYRIAPAVLVARLLDANNTKWVAWEALGRLREDFHRFRQRCETCKALAGALAKDDQLLAGRCACLLQASWTPSKVLAHPCDAWTVQS